MPEPPLRGENSGNPFAGIKNGADGYVGNLILAAAMIAFATLPWMANDKSFLKIMPYVSAACGGYALYLLVEIALRIQRRVAWVEVDEQSLRWQARGETHQKTWSDVTTFHRKERLINGVPIGSVKVEFRDNTELQFNRMLSNYDAVASRIQDLAASVIGELKERELAAGMAKFGPVTLRKAGLDYRGREHNWANIDYSVFRGNLVFVPAGKAIDPNNVTTQILLEEIPDYAVLLELMERHGKPGIRV